MEATSSETSSSANLSHMTWVNPKTKRYQLFHGESLKTSVNVLLWCGCYGNVLYCYGADVTEMCCIVMVRMLRKCVVLLWCGCYGNVLYCYGANVTEMCCIVMVRMLRKCVVLSWCGCYGNVLCCHGADVTEMCCIVMVRMLRKCVVLLWCGCYGNMASAWPFWALKDIFHDWALWSVELNMRYAYLFVGAPKICHSCRILIMNKEDGSVGW
jgi:hypothetical protein